MEAKGWTDGSCMVHQEARGDGQRKESPDPKRSGRPAPRPASTWFFLDLQRQVGNHAVVGMLNGAAVVQRQSRGEYVPEMSVKPDQQQAVVGVKFREQLTVRNVRKAPAGTRFHWGGGIEDPDRLRFDAIAPTTRGGASRLEATALRSGTPHVRATLQHQVPGGPARTWPGPAIPVIIPRPTITLRPDKHPAAPGGNPSPNRLAVGDRLTLHATLSNVAPRLNFSQVWEVGSGPGQVAGASAGAGVRTPTGGLPTGGRAVEQSDSRTVNDTQHDAELIARSPGPFEVNVGWQLIDHAEQPPLKASFSGSVEMDRRRFIDKCSEAHTLAGGQYAYLSSNNALLANMYGTAWKRHTDWLKEADATQRLIEGLIFNAALAFIPGGVGGLIGARVRNWYAEGSAAGNFMSDAMKDLFKDTARRYGGQAIGGMHTPAYAAFPPDPLMAQNQTTARTEREKADVLMMINSWQAAANDHPEVVLDFDPVEAVRNACTLQGKAFEELPAPDDRDARLFEKGFWQKWIDVHGYFIRETYSCAGMSRRVDDNVSKDIRKGVRECASALGEDGDQWLSAWGGIASARLEKQIASAGGGL